jgi:hypothetical protein
MKPFPSALVKEKLRSDPGNPLHFFRDALADALPTEDMYGIAFALQARLLLHTKPGYPPMLYAAIELELPALAREVLPEGIGEEIAVHLETT